jgi:hypothetical protein
MKVVVCGDRHWSDYSRILHILIQLPMGSLIIQGGCRGADRLAVAAAEELGHRWKEILANWDLHGRAAGPIRNTEMLSENPDMVLAFHDNIEQSLGSRDTVRKARARGIPALVFQTIGDDDERLFKSLLP